MKKAAFITFAILVLTTSVTFAQHEQTGSKSAEQRTALITKNMTQELSLSESQIEEVKDVVLKREKLRDAGLLSKEHQKEIDEDLNQILTKDQQKQWSQIQKEEKGSE
jgi:hypothetical protein